MWEISGRNQEVLSFDTIFLTLISFPSSPITISFRHGRTLNSNEKLLVFERSSLVKSAQDYPSIYRQNVCNKSKVFEWNCHYKGIRMQTCEFSSEYSLLFKWMLKFLKRNGQYVCMLSISKCETYSINTWCLFFSLSHSKLRQNSNSVRSLIDISTPCQYYIALAAVLVWNTWMFRFYIKFNICQIFPFSHTFNNQFQTNE